MKRGADPDEWRTEQFIDDLLAHVRGDSDPQVTILLVEEPFGRASTPIRAIVDLAIHIHLPLGVSLARRLLRDFVPDLSGSTPGGLDRLRVYLHRYIEGGGAAYEAIDDGLPVDMTRDRSPLAGPPVIRLLQSARCDGVSPLTR